MFTHFRRQRRIWSAAILAALAGLWMASAVAACADAAPDKAQVAMADCEMDRSAHPMLDCDLPPTDTPVATAWSHAFTPALLAFVPASAVAPANVSLLTHPDDPAPPPQSPAYLAHLVLLL